MFGEHDGCNQIWICINDQHKKPYFENKFVIFYYIQMFKNSNIIQNSMAFLLYSM